KVILVDRNEDVFVTAKQYVGAAGKSVPRPASPGYPWGVRTRDHGATWTTVYVPDGSQPLGAITAAGTLLVPTFGGLVRSSDGGDTWDLMRTPVPSGFVDMVAGPSSRVFAAAYDGVYASFDDGRTWSEISSFRSFTIAVSPDERTVLALDPWTPELREIPVDAPETGRVLPRIGTS